MRALWLVVLAPQALVWAQSALPCSCGANPPGLPPAREVAPYAGAPEDMRPFSKFTKPYYEHYTKQVEYNGAARDVPIVKPEEVDEVRIGFLGPVENHPDERLGKMMLNGAMLAVEEANAAGGYGGKPFKLMVHNDQAIWGASSNEIVKMTYDDKVWAMFGSISGDSTHIALRVSLKTELPIVNSAATDPTIPETIIPWYLTTLQDDRVQGYTLARRIYTDLGLQRIALLRVNDRYGRFGVLKFKDASRRLGHPVVIEQKYLPGETDFRRSLRIIKESGADGIVVWGDAGPARAILKQMGEVGMKVPVFGSYRVLGDEALPEGIEVVFPYDPTRDDPVWLAFQQRFAKRYDRPPEVFASLAYDTMNILLHAICRAGLNRARIRDALAGLESYKGVTGSMVFDPNSKNTVPMYLASRQNGKLRYRRYPMQMPYARVGQNSLDYNGPPAEEAQRRIGVFGPHADALAVSLKAPGYTVIGVPSDVPWGKASSELVRLVYEERIVALIATDRNSSHLAEQIAVKALVPLIAISADHDLTSLNIPWIFRLPPEATVEDALAQMLQALNQSGQDRGRLRQVLALGAR